jgi:hypothetical protein
MPVKPENFKQDPCSPHELAKAILDHEYTPGGSNSFSLTFREELFLDHLSLNEKEHGAGLLFTLKRLEERLPVDGGLGKDRLRHALEVIDAYRKESAESRDRNAKEAAGHDGVTAEGQRGAAEAMETCMVEISNLASIERLTRTLAHKLGVFLIEPGPRKQQR